MTQYTVTNSQQSAFNFVDSSGSPRTLLPGGSGTFDLSPAWYNTLVASLGASYVVPVIVTQYRYGILAVTPVATPTDVVVIQGSASQVVRIKKIRISGVATAQGNMPVQVVRRSTAGTAGSAVLTAITAAKHDVNDATPTAVVSTVGTANYTTLGTSAGVLTTSRISLGASGTGTGGDGNVTEFNLEEDPTGNGPFVLRGTSDFICINFNGAAVPSGGVLDFTIETMESAV